MEVLETVCNLQVISVLPGTDCSHPPDVSSYLEVWKVTPNRSGRWQWKIFHKLPMKNINHKLINPSHVRCCHVEKSADLFVNASQVLISYICRQKGWQVMFEMGNISSHCGAHRQSLGNIRVFMHIQEINQDSVKRGSAKVDWQNYAEGPAGASTSGPGGKVHVSSGY